MARYVKLATIAPEPPRLGGSEAGNDKAAAERMQRFWRGRLDQVWPDEPDLAARIRILAGGAEMIVDALFGTGLQGPLRGDYRALIDAINALDIPILAVDIPSGLDCDTGQPLGTALISAVEPPSAESYSPLKRFFANWVTVSSGGVLFAQSARPLPGEGAGGKVAQVGPAEKRRDRHRGQ